MLVVFGVGIRHKLMIFVVWFYFSFVLLDVCFEFASATMFGVVYLEVVLVDVVG